MIVVAPVVVVIVVELGKKYTKERKQHLARLEIEKQVTAHT